MIFSLACREFWFGGGGIIAMVRNFWAALGFEGRSQPMTKKICKHYLEKTNENAYFKANLNKNGGFGGRSPRNFLGLLRFFQKICVFFEHLLPEKICQSFREKN